MSDGKVTIVVDVDGNKVKVLNDELDKTAQKGDRGSSSLKKFAVGSAVFQLAAKGAELLGEALGGAIQRFDTLESYPRVMQAMGHSTEDVTRSTKKLAAGIEGLPTTLNEVVGTAQRLTSITGDINKSTDLTLALNNAFLASGSSSADASRGLHQFSQMLSAGKVDMQSWKTLQETMPYALQKTAESFGFAGQSAQNDFYSALKEGRITFNQFSRKLVELNGGVGGFAELAKTNSKGIQTSFGNLKNAVVKGVANTIKALDDLTKAATGKTIAENFDALKVIINAAFGVIVNVIKASTPVFQTLFSILGIGASVISFLRPAIIGLVAALVTMRAINQAVKTTKDLISAWKIFKLTATRAIRIINLLTAAQATYGSITKAQLVAHLANNGALTASNLLYGVLTGSISLQTAATIAATAATTAFKAGLTAVKAALTALTGPIGLVVAGVGLAVGALVGLWQWLTAESEETKRLKSEQEELVKSTDQLTDSVKQSAKERQKNLESVKGNTESYQKLADEIVQLSQKTNKTAADKKNLKKKIDALNASVSGLNLAYDKNSDSLSHNSDEIKARISAMEAESTWETSQKNLLDIEQKRAEIGEQLKQIAEQRKKWNEESNVSDGVRKERLQELNDKETELKNTQTELQTEYEKTSQVQQAASEAMAAAAENGSNRQVVAYENMSKSQQKAIDDMRTKYNELLETTTNMFEQIKYKSAISVDEMIANLQKNQEAVNNWATNLNTLAERGVNEGILAKLQAMGPQGGLYVQELVNASDEKLATLNEVFTQGGESAMNGLTAGMDTGALGITDKIKGIVQSQVSSLQEEIAAADFSSLGQEIPNGVSQGIEQGASTAGESSKNMANDIKESFTSEMDINSPSRVFNEYGGFITTGLAEGVDKGTNQPVSSVTNLANQIKKPFDSLQSDFTYIGEMAMSGLNAGLWSGSGSVMATANSIAERVKATIKSALDIHSPSRAMRDEVGRFIPQGIAVGIEADAGVVEKSMLRLKESMMIDTRPEIALGLNKKLGAQVTVKQSSKQTIAEKIKVTMDKSSELLKKALDVAETAVRRPNEMYLNDGTLVAKTGDKFAKYQSEQLRRDNRMKGVLS
ncbi:phage minor tail protein [Streptococcus pneumoniae]|uniref:tape measure protein n=1 Tax=Streptococcus pneumoniae TaxID=1313 RepID=UPI000254B6A6|nr:tape measure protein [Streptococcus pneumoniae]EHZ41731.1 tape measure domain protein [Streptococcus pneumoniae GA40183]MDY6728870.1 tape measure protein [Streptococcus pneumoniae]CVM58805.1 phage minor tail protein [Streptococcus pneumoniae]CVQ96730.1 phage minor tail protein [Streptococcus pneumoniae]CVW02783.1 phage minor tail protein [Streptococcus pneumoniae]